MPVSSKEAMTTSPTHRHMLTQLAHLHSQSPPHIRTHFLKFTLPSHTHTHIVFHILTLTVNTHSHSFTFTLSHSHYVTHGNILTHSCSHTLSYSYSYTLMLTHSIILLHQTHTVTHIHRHTDTLTPMVTHPHTFIFILTLSHPLTPSPSHSTPLSADGSKTPLWFKNMDPGQEAAQVRVLPLP